MKSFLPTLLLATTLVTTALSPLTPAIAQPSSGLKFYCGQAKDPSSRQSLPATVAKISSSSEEIVLVVWKSEFFGTKYTPQQRCGIVSAKIQNAFQKGRTYLGSGIDQASGAGIVCGVAKPTQTCDRQNMIFTIKSYQSADDTIAQIGDIIQGKTGQPVYQSSTGKRVNLQNLASKRR
jgi:hypothetical protein